MNPVIGHGYTAWSQQVSSRSAELRVYELATGHVTIPILGTSAPGFRGRRPWDETGTPALPTPFQSRECDPLQPVPSRRPSRATLVRSVSWPARPIGWSGPDLARPMGPGSATTSPPGPSETYTAPSHNSSFRSSRDLPRLVRGGQELHRRLRFRRRLRSSASGYAGGRRHDRGRKAVGPRRSVDVERRVGPAPRKAIGTRTVQGLIDLM